MKICIDVDGVICRLKRGQETYADILPIDGAQAKLRALKDAGHYLVLYTARHMKTCDSNVGLVLARQAKTLLDWLEEYKIPYDEIYFGKPHADVYIDDNAYRFSSWDLVKDDGSNLPLSNEKKQHMKEQSKQE